MMRVQLKEAQEERELYENNRKEFVASISHDLKTPLTSIKGYVKGVLDGVANTPEKANSYMETIYRKADDMDHLIDELFLYSKLDLQRVPFTFESIDLDSYFHDFLEELRFHTELNDVQISYSANPKGTYLIRADRMNLGRVVSNIIQNSLKYMDKEHKEIQVSLQSESDRVIVKITDNGMGITEQAIPYIFNSFYRTDLSRNSSTGGSGLGLAIVKRIIDEHNGDIWAESKLGEGTSISFTLQKTKEK
jgi:histidine kinase